jgi:hypothetical protein
MFWLRWKTLSGPYGESSPTLLTAAAESGLGSLATTSTGSCGRLALGAGSGLLLPGERSRRSASAATFTHGSRVSRTMGISRSVFSWYLP